MFEHNYILLCFNGHFIDKSWKNEFMPIKSNCVTNPIQLAFTNRKPDLILRSTRMVIYHISSFYNWTLCFQLVLCIFETLELAESNFMIKYHPVILNLTSQVTEWRKSSSVSVMTDIRGISLCSLAMVVTPQYVRDASGSVLFPDRLLHKLHGRGLAKSTICWISFSLLRPISSPSLLSSVCFLFFIIKSDSRLFTKQKLCAG